MLRKMREVDFRVRRCGVGRWERICSRSSAVVRMAVMADDRIIGVVVMLVLGVRGCRWSGLVPS